MKITSKQKELMAEIQADPVAFQKLKDKCRWERMSRYAVLNEWGDPRKWGEGTDNDAE